MVIRIDDFVVATMLIGMKGHCLSVSSNRTITFSMCCVPSTLKVKKKLIMHDNRDEVLLK